jgi:ATP-dependent protease HslVU (ClpYQ) ATPase subunit
LYIPEGMIDKDSGNVMSSRNAASSNLSLSQLKVKDIRKFMYEIYGDDVFSTLKIEDFVKNEIETKGIIVIDEIDKLVRQQDGGSSTKASDEGV